MPFDVNRNFDTRLKSADSGSQEVRANERCAASQQMHAATASEVLQESLYVRSQEQPTCSREQTLNSSDLGVLLRSFDECTFEVSTANFVQQRRKNIFAGEYTCRVSNAFVDRSTTTFFLQSHTLLTNPVINVDCLALVSNVNSASEPSVISPGPVSHHGVHKTCHAMQSFDFFRTVSDLQLIWSLVLFRKMIFFQIYPGHKPQENLTCYYGAVDDVGVELASLCHGTRHNCGCCCSKHKLKEE